MLPPAASQIAFMRARLVACVATRRCGVTLVFRIVRGASTSDEKYVWWKQHGGYYKLYFDWRVHS